MSVKRTLLVSLCLVILTSRAAADPYEEAAEAAMQGDLVLMQQRYERILASNPDDVRALNGKATAQAWRGNYFAAIETYQKALSLEPENIESLVGAGYAFSWAGDHAYAVDSFEKALESAPGHRIHVRHGRGGGGLFLHRGGREPCDFEMCGQPVAQCPDGAISLDPRGYDAHYVLGRLRFSQGRTAESAAPSR